MLRETYTIGADRSQAGSSCLTGNYKHMRELFMLPGVAALAHLAVVVLCGQRGEVPGLHLVLPQLHAVHILHLGELLVLPQLISIKLPVMLVIHLLHPALL